jgi:hypothetical protein
MSRTRFPSVAALALLLSSACGAKPSVPAEPTKAKAAAPLVEKGEPAAPEPASEPPPDFGALLAREATDLPREAVDGPDGAFTARVSSAGLPESTLENGIPVVQIPIDAGAPVRCHVLPGDVDAGSTLAGLFADARAKVEFQRVAPWSVSVIRGAPAAFLRATYAVQRGERKLLGELKAMFHAVPMHAVLCVHDELGYEKTFLTVATEFAQSIAHRGASPSPAQLVEVHELKVQDHPIGFSRSHTMKTSGKVTHHSVAFIMFPIAENEVQFGDYVEIQDLDASGQLKAAAWAKALNGNVELQVQLEQLQGGEYRYSGRVKDQPLSGTFTTKNKTALPGYVLNAKRLAPYATSARPFSIETFEYTPDVDPAAPTPVRYHRDVGDAARTVRISKPTQERTGMLDAQGMTETLTVPVGQLTMQMTRLFVERRP